VGGGLLPEQAAAHAVSDAASDPQAVVTAGERVAGVPPVR